VNNDNISIKNSVWKNAVILRTNQDIGLKIPRDIRHTMMHILITVNHSGKGFFMAAIFNFEDNVGPAIMMINIMKALVRPIHSHLQKFREDV
jgi:hypothetical protein